MPQSVRNWAKTFISDGGQGQQKSPGRMNARDFSKAENQMVSRLNGSGRTSARLGTFRDVARDEVGRNFDGPVAVAEGDDGVSALSDGCGCCPTEADDDRN